MESSRDLINKFNLFSNLFLSNHYHYHKYNRPPIGSLYVFFCFWYLVAMWFLLSKT